MIDDDTRICRNHGPGSSLHVSSGFEPIPMNDVECCLRECSDAFGQLAALLRVIEKNAAEHSDLSKLAALGWASACDMDNFAASTLEQMQKGGVRK